MCKFVVHMKQFLIPSEKWINQFSLKNNDANFSQNRL